MDRGHELTMGARIAPAPSNVFAEMGKPLSDGGQDKYLLVCFNINCN
jgi:hypothetical protein